ncbi:hypothetical protein P4O66_002561 [Electrophorus voltai]|uniref:Reverse transcriptase/retrotransposon-derived protein RNase H-like domain-containing protein n=1 Tax=Electrophorus voltai TaxID=2609070 RepID=A0AAD9DQ92_9TELE|nr:hypothetical protein P4O66_002561 [Electrophorus voltai]
MQNGRTSDPLQHRPDHEYEKEWFGKELPGELLIVFPWRPRTIRWLSRSNFLMQRSMYFSHYAMQFITDKDRVQIVLSLLTGEANALGTTLWDSQDPMLRSEMEFYNLFKAVFNHPASGRDPRTILCEIRQGRQTVADLRLIEMVHDETWISMLSPGLQTCRGESTTLTEFIQLAITVDNLRQTPQPLQRASHPHTFVLEDSNNVSGEVPEQMRGAFVSAPVFCQPDPSLPFIVEVDASEVGVGAVLFQRQGTPPRLYPCAFYAKKLQPDERNYDVGNRELLAVKLALEQWRH